MIEHFSSFNKSSEFIERPSLELTNDDKQKNTLIQNNPKEEPFNNCSNIKCEHIIEDVQENNLNLVNSFNLLIYNYDFY